MKNLKTIAVVALVCSLGVALADDDPYADYVKLTQSDTSSNHSWDRIGHWDDPSGEAPNDGKNYYVPAGMELYRPASTDTSFNLWKGGQLVLAGLFNNNVSASNSNGPVIPDLVLLGGSEIRLSALGPFAPSINNITTTVTVASSAASPALITSQLKGAINSNGGLQCDRNGACENDSLEKVPMVVAELPEALDARQFVAHVKRCFSVECAHCNELLQRPIKKVAICGGAADFMLDEAIASGADAFITGEMHYHSYFGHEQEIQICVIGHYESEQFTSEIFREIIEKACPGVACQIAETNTNPIKYY